MKLTITHALTAGVLLLATLASQANAAIALDRTRVIFNGSSKSVSLNISNENKHLPYLAQGWVEDESGNKISSPLIVLPPVQRIESGAKSQVKVQGLPATQQLPQDRESLFYFNLREIPPRSDKPNTLQIALQTRIKLFYRPQAIEPTKEQMSTPWQEQMTLTRQGDRYVVNNPTPYYITIVDASTIKGGKSAQGFVPLMVPPKSNAPLSANASALGNSPVLTYVNDYGGRPELIFRCAGETCQAEPGKRNS
ncbi:fimbria/pilus periplasmic chaperone [Serratia fonticola]|jgi:chaperone protein PapD|uniref:fimbria/pilus periplasmic chaperone n=1 Tax=Serratia fonticola TaxID=47917 RepID=UPI002177C74E|nr:fimbria/pilus periplasmic chaperone [Serratia fonticola]CAI1010266.1 Chaperone protein papD precursor [Serratia fonticola]CAI1011435.1 Chaperone protein papD precursor [Serratia fonticola]CAI1613232.1 Chaperone protein papD precursor [Serratia fonticola]CAI1739957.1 Chaperone protein papD precursor [Serratia fonticola]CAI1786246.1 Chaperone protein papD precursor [Serratia fonticola]